VLQLLLLLLQSEGGQAEAESEAEGADDVASDSCGDEPYSVI